MKTKIRSIVNNSKSAITADLRKSWYGIYVLSLLHEAESHLIPRLISDENAVKKYFKRVTGRDFDPQHLESFCDKLNWYKLNDHEPLMQICADKFAVREYVTKCGYPEILNELYGVYDSVEEIDLKSLPSRFVFKAAHGSHMNIVYPDTPFKWWQCKLLMNSWLRQDIYWSCREWVYKDMPRRIIAERYLEDETGELRDYKLFCYHGKPQFLQFDAGRFKDIHYRNFYDMNLNLLDITDKGGTVNPELIPIDQENFQKMKRIAEDISKPFQFVRTDFYFVNGKIYFGELTFFDGGGYSGFSKEEYDVIFGEPWKIR